MTIPEITAYCGVPFGRGIGGVLRRCRKPADHVGRHSDMPFLEDLRAVESRVAEKIERDSFQTRGASWGKNLEGEQARRNRQPRWTLGPGHVFYPAHHQTYEVCLEIAAELTLQAYEMVGAPPCPVSIAPRLSRQPIVDSGICPICRLPLELSEFALAQQSKAAIDTDHLNPKLIRRHTPGNVYFVHHECNTTKGDRSLDEFVNGCRAPWNATVSPSSDNVRATLLLQLELRTTHRLDLREKPCALLEGGTEAVNTFRPRPVAMQDRQSQLKQTFTQGSKG